MPPARRTRRIRESTLWAAAATAVMVHGAILGTVHAFGLTMITEGFTVGGVARMEAPEVADLDESSCVGNVLLATSGRTAICLGPWVSDVDQCLADAQMSLWMDLSSCQARNDPSTAIAVIEQRTAEKLRPIDAEKLLEEFRQAKKPTPPPPVPPPPQQVQPPPPPPPAPQQPALPQQVVETAKPTDEKEPENARFLSEYNTRVEKQKVARGARNEPMVAKSAPEQLAAKDKPRDEPSVKEHEPRDIGKNPHAPDVPGHLSMRSPGTQAPAEVDQEAKVRGSSTGAAGSLVADGFVPRKGDSAIEQQRRERSEIPRGQGGAGGGAPDAPNLKPTQEILERALGGGSVDHLEEVDNGDETSLNSKRWVYASFFNRLKRQVAQNWDPITVWRHKDPTGVVYGAKTRVTEVRVSLSRRGQIERILVSTPSGVTELDDEAMRAFRAAGPFPNPPDGLVQKDDLITFGFSFFFEIGAPRITWRLPQAM